MLHDAELCNREELPYNNGSAQARDSQMELCRRLRGSVPMQWHKRALRQLAIGELEQVASRLRHIGVT